MTLQTIGLDSMRRQLDADPMRERRRLNARDRLRVETDDYVDLVLARIGVAIDTGQAQAQLRKFVLPIFNPMRRIADRVASPYKRPPERTVEGDENNRKLTELLRVMRFDLHTARLARYAFLFNVVFAVPTMTSRRGYGYPVPSIATVLPSVADVILADDGETVDILTYEAMRDGKPIRVVSDTEATTWLTDNWQPHPDSPGAHSLGILPASEWRLALPPPTDFWDWNRGRKMVMVTVECARIIAMALLVRKGQNRRLLSVFSEDLDMIPDGQVATPESAFTAPLNPGEISFRVDDFETSIKEFDREIRWLFELAAEDYGVPLEAFDPSGMAFGEGSDSINAGPFAMVARENALAEIREAQIPFLREAERDLLWRISLWLTQLNHPLAISPDVVRDTYAVTFPPASYAEHPLARMEILRSRMSLGLESPAGAYRSEVDPHLTEAEAMERVMDNLSAKAEVDEFMAKRNLPADPADQSANIAVLQGKLGQMEK